MVLQNIGENLPDFMALGKEMAESDYLLYGYSLSKYWQRGF
jgi:hypothetical protein